MSFDGNGTYVRLYDWTDDRDNGIKIDSTRMDAEFDGIAIALSSCLVRDGQAAMTGNLPMGSQRITGLSSGAVGTPSVAFTAATTSGMYWNGTGLGLVNGGTERLTVSTTGVAVTGTLSSSGAATLNSVVTATINNTTGTVLQYNGTGRVTTTSTGASINGKLVTTATATGGAGFNLPHGTAPTSPADGDVWSTTTALFARINGATVQYGAAPNVTEANSSISAGSGSAGTGASQNAVFGNGAGALLSTTGDFNVAIGYQALSGGAADSSVAVGHQALKLATTSGGVGTINIGIGKGAGSAITTGGDNTLIGGYTGSTTLSSMVALSTPAGTRKFWHDNTDAFVLHATTASAANAFLDSSTNALKRSTSSLKYKREVSKMELKYAKELLRLEPIFYKSAISTDKQDWSHYGFAAEELAEIEPRFVQYTVHPDDYTPVDVNGERFPIENPRLVPDGVAYDRIVVPLLMLVKDLNKRVKALEGGAE